MKKDVASFLIFRIGFFLFFSIIIFGSKAQSANDIDRVLLSVQANNTQLKSLKAYIKSEQLNIQSTNNLPDPEVSGYYLPQGAHPDGDYTEYQVSQAFEFPTLYAARKKWIKEQSNQLQIQLEITQKQILLEAEKHCLNLIYLNKKTQLQQERIAQSKEVFDLITELVERGESNKHELNQAKIGWVINQFTLENTRQEHRGVLTALQQLNGGVSIEFESQEYPKPLSIEHFDSIWAEKIIMDPILKDLEKEKQVSYRNININKHQGLPDLVIGYNYQGVPGYDYSGLYGGLTIPLWSNRNKVKAAQVKHESVVLNYSEKTAKYQSELIIKYSDFQFYLNKYNEYQNTLEGLTQDLLHSYKNEEITYVQYLMELYFYKEAFNAYLEIEHDLYRLKAELLSHQL
ncbi:MAG: TolC family protein [Reichenbachiella sp.]|uniref:TolC family protein n=1 Tax=Reichenbachiella sp. TaxID=2184521 RepID=UPI003297AD7A